MRSSRHHFLVAPFAIFLITVVTFAAAEGQNPDPDRRVMVIGLDGLVPEAVGSPYAPNINALFQGGGGLLLEGYTEDLTFSGPSWSSILHGVHRDRHGVTSNSYDGHDFTSWPSFLKRIKNHVPDLHTAAFVTWPLLQNNFQTPEGSVVGVDQLVYYNSHEEDGDERVTREAVELLETGDPGAIFFYQNDIDAAGHGYGFYMELREYRDQVRETDSRVGRVIDAIHRRSGVKSGQEKWLILVVTDHGGVGTGHSGNLLRQRTIPLVVSGEAVQGVKKPEFRVRNVDVNRTVLNFMGLPEEELEQLDGRDWLEAGDRYPVPEAVFGQNLVFNGSGDMDRAFTDREIDQVPTGWQTQEHTGLEHGYHSMTLYRPSGSVIYRDAETDEQRQESSLFSGGSQGNYSRMTQWIDISELERPVDSREVGFEMEAWLGTRTSGERMTFRATFYDSKNRTIGSAALENKDVESVGNTPVLERVDTAEILPIGTRSLRFELQAFSASGEGSGIDAYADRLSFQLKGAE